MVWKNKFHLQSVPPDPAWRIGDWTCSVYEESACHSLLYLTCETCKLCASLLPTCLQCAFASLRTATHSTQKGNFTSYLGQSRGSCLGWCTSRQDFWFYCWWDQWATALSQKNLEDIYPTLKLEENVYTSHAKIGRRGEMYWKMCSPPTLKLEDVDI